MRSLRFILALVLSLGLNLTVSPNAQAWFFNYGLMIPDADMYWAPEPAPVKKSVPTPAPKPVIPAPPAPAPAPAPVVAYTPPQATLPSSLLRRLPPEDVYVAPAPAPAPRPTAAPAPVVQPVVIAQPRQIESYDPVNDAIIIGGGRTVRPAPAVVQTPPSTPPSIPSTLRFPEPSTQTTVSTASRSDGTKVTTTTVTTTSYVFDTSKPTVNKDVPLGQTGAVPLTSVQFNLNKDTFVDNRSAQQKLADSILAAAKAGNTVMQLEGHASPEGSYRANQTLSEKRADQVRDDMSVLLRGLGWDCGAYRKAANTEASSCSAPDGSVKITLQPVGFSEKFADTSKLPAGCNINVSAGNSAKCEKALSEMRKTDIFMTNPPSITTSSTVTIDKVDTIRGNTCPDGSPMPANGQCERTPPPTTRVCPDGTVVPVTAPCPTTPPPATKVCPDGTVVPVTAPCPTTPPPATKTCPDGSVVPVTAPCPTTPPPATKTCPDGSVVPVTAPCPTTPPPATKTCPNGSVVPATAPCPSSPPPPPPPPPGALCDIPNGILYTMGLRPGDTLWVSICLSPNPTPTPTSGPVRPS